MNSFMKYDTNVSANTDRPLIIYSQAVPRICGDTKTVHTYKAGKIFKKM